MDVVVTLWTSIESHHLTLSLNTWIEGYFEQTKLRDNSYLAMIILTLIITRRVHI